MKIIYCSTWAVLAVFCQIINIIQKNWFNSYPFNFENFDICAIYLLYKNNVLKIFHCLIDQMDVK